MKRILRSPQPYNCIILRPLGGEKSDRPGGWPRSPEEKPAWQCICILPGKPCSSPRTATAPLTAGESGQGYRDLGAENTARLELSGQFKEEGGVGSVPKPAIRKSFSERRLQPSPSSENPNSPRTQDGNRKTHAPVLCGAVAATFPSSPHCESCALWQEVQPQT
jgi:hypothetical protein